MEGGRTVALRKDTDPQHRWLVASTHEVSRQDAAYVAEFGVLEWDMIRRDPNGHAEALDTYCAQCRRPYDDVADEVCEPAVDGYAHLIGGPIGRRKRIHDHDCAAFGCNPVIGQVQAEALRRLAANPAPYRVAL